MWHYWHFQEVTPKQYYTLFQTSNNTDISRVLLENNITHLSRVYIKQYWHFQSVPSKLNFSETFFQRSYHTILTLSESYYQTILTYSQLISNSIHTFTELLLNNSKHFFGSLNEHLNRQQLWNWNSQVKLRKISIHTWNRSFRQQPIFEFTWLVIDGFMEENGPASPLPKRKLGHPTTERHQEIWSFPSF